MATEVERKFLLPEVPAWITEYSARRVDQGYLAIADDAEVRVRIIGDEAALTVKSGHGEVRSEVEVALGADQLEVLWPLTESLRLTKTRRRVPLGEGDLAAEVDAFGGDLEGLVVAEVEFGSVAASRGFEPPEWLGAEITGNQRFANQSLAREGRPGDGDSDEGGEAGPSRAYRLKHGEGTRKGLPRIAFGRAEDALEHLASAADGDSAIHIHQARKDLKKLRSLLRLVRDRIGERIFARENERYRDAGQRLGAARDAEVMLETLSDLEKRFPGELPGGSITLLRAQLEEERRENGPDLEGAAAMISEGLGTVGDWAAQGGGWESLEPGLRRSYGRGRKLMKRTADDPSPENVHQWRKRAKDLWYQLRILRDAWPEVIGEASDQTHELAEQLGDHHDLVLLSARVEAHTELFADPGDLELLRTLIEHREEQLLERAFEIGRRLYAEKPRAFTRRIEAYWRAWRAG